MVLSFVVLLRVLEFLCIGTEVTFTFAWSFFNLVSRCKVTG